MKILFLIFFIIFSNKCFADEPIILFDNKNCLYYKEIKKLYPELLNINLIAELKNIKGYKKKQCVLIDTFYINLNKYFAIVSGSTYFCGSGGCFMQIFNNNTKNIIFNQYIIGDVIILNNKLILPDIKKELIIED